MITRRDFLKFVGMMGLVLITPIRRLNLFSHKNLEDDASGELYAGFLILPEGAPIPNIVKEPKWGFPNECGIGSVSNVPDHTFVTEEFPTLNALSDGMKVPIYSLKEIPKGMRLGNISTIRTVENGDTYLVSLGYETYHADVEVWQCTIWLLTQMDFPSPIPIWYGNPVEPNGPATIPEKVDFLPSPGLMIKTPDGYVFHWIENDMLFTLSIEGVQNISEAEAVVQNLTK